MLDNRHFEKHCGFHNYIPVLFSYSALQVQGIHLSIMGGMKEYRHTKCAKKY